MITVNNRHQQTSFQAYIKVKDSQTGFNHMKHFLDKKLGFDYCLLNQKKTKNKVSASLLTKKDYDKFLDLLKLNHPILELKENLTKYLGKKPKKMTCAEVIKHFDKK